MLAQYSDPLITLALFLAAGLVVDQLLFSLVRSRTAQSGWLPGKRLAQGLHGLPTATGLLIGVHSALLRADLPLRTLATAQRMTTVVAILVATAFAARILGGLVRSYAERESSRLPSSSIFVNLARGLVWVLGLMSLLGALGIAITPLITALGVGGIAVGLALQPTLENVFSGVQILASRQIGPGDFVRLQTGEEGHVRDVTWRNTMLERPSGELVIVPNGLIGRSLVTNFSAGDGAYTLTMPLTLPLGDDVSRVVKLAEETAARVVAEESGCDRDVAPTVRLASITAPNYVLEVSICVKSYAQRVAVQDAFIRGFHARLHEGGHGGA